MCKGREWNEEEDHILDLFQDALSQIAKPDVFPFSGWRIRERMERDVQTKTK
jgi:hypothetical protein